MAAMHSKSGAGREREPGSGKGAPGVKKHSNRVHPPGAASSASNSAAAINAQSHHQNMDHNNSVNGLSQ